MAPHSTDIADYPPSDGLRLRTSVASGPASDCPLEKYTLEDVSHHSSPSDCWLVIWGKVYDVTRWYESCNLFHEIRGTCMGHVEIAEINIQDLLRSE